MFCTQCGKEIEDGSRFCEYCGEPCEENEEYIIEPEYKKKSYKVPMIIGLLTLSIVMCLASIFLLQKKADDEKARQRREAQEKMQKEKEEQEEQERLAELEEEQDYEEEEEWESEEPEESEYLIEDSDVRLLTDYDVEGMSLWEINYAKNEIYARHGRRFKSQELQSYFDEQSWYEGKYSPKDFDKNYSADVLNEYEKKNADFLKSKELERSPNGYQLDQN